MQTNPAVEQNKNRGISPVGKEKVYGGNEILNKENGVKCCVLPYRERSSSYLACLSSFLHTTGHTAENVTQAYLITAGLYTARLY